MGKACWEPTSCSHGSFVWWRVLHPRLSVTEKTLATEPQGNNLAAKATNKITRCVCEMYVREGGCGGGGVSVRESEGKRKSNGGKSGVRLG